MVKIDYKKLIKKNEIWGLIPARAGSTRIKNKNIIKINSYPLISYSIILSKQIKEISRTFVTTDSKNIQSVSNKYGAETPFLRSKKISHSKSLDIEYFKEFINFFILKGILPEYIIQLRPSTPFRDINIVKKAIRIMKKSRSYSGLRSSSIFSHPPEKLFRIKNKKYTNIFFKKTKESIFNAASQSYPPTYLPNGYVDIVKTSNLFKSQLYGDNILPLITPKIIDIDQPEDLNLAKVTLNKEKKALINKLEKIK